MELYKTIRDKKGERNTLGNLGSSYSSLEQFDIAIDYFQQSLEIARNIGDLQGEASTLYSLGNTYQKSQQISQAIQAYRDSLKIATPSTLPSECFIAGLHLGNLAFKVESWQIAIEGYISAIEATDTIFDNALSDHFGEKVISAGIEAYFGIVQAYINTYQYVKAIEYVERSKARSLTKNLSYIELCPKGNISKTTNRELRRLRQEILSERKQLENEQRNGSLRRVAYQKTNHSEIIHSEIIPPDRTRLYHLQQQLDEFILHNITPIDLTFNLTQKIETILYSDIQSLKGV